MSEKSSAPGSDWSYNEFLAFLMIYGAEMNNALSDQELLFISTRTGVKDIEKIKRKVDNISDARAIEVIDEYKKTYLVTPDLREKVKHDLEELLKAPGEHSQFEKVVVHLIEKLI